VKTVAAQLDKEKIDGGWEKRFRFPSPVPESWQRVWVCMWERGLSPAYDPCSRENAASFRKGDHDWKTIIFFTA